MPKVISLFIGIIISFQVFAERLGRSAQLYEKPGKRTIAQLTEGISISILEEKEGWVKIVTTAYTLLNNFNTNTLELNRSTPLLGDDGSPVGKVYSKLKLSGLYSISTTASTVYFEVIGYVRKSDIDKDWIPEDRLIYLIDSAKSKITYDELKPEMDKYGFTQTINDSNFVAYQLDDVFGMDYDNPKERMKLIFYENRLVAIFHSKPFPLKTKEVIQIGGQENLIYLRDLSAAEKKIFGELFLNN